ncbi:MAG TPA: aryl-sulfate sulfotransferase [Bacteroidia bacterium]|nr:aryl-sulfate sulfotransferase [Bacteroidia bacterium]
MKHLFTKICALLLISLTINAQQWNGLTLVATQNSTTAKLVDTAGTAVKTYSPGTGSTGYSAYLEPGGTMVRSLKISNTTFNGGGACGAIQKVDYNNNVIWTYTVSSSTQYSHHDHCVMPNGNVLIISYESKTQTELAAAGGTNTALTSIWPEKIIEVQPTGATSGTIVWEWHVWDHLVQNVNSSKANYQTSIVNHPELLNVNYKSTKDWLHMNGIDYNPILDQIVVSSHNLNEWYVIDHSTTTAEAASHSGGNSGKGGDFLYRWGNPTAYGASGTTILNVTHDAHWVPEDVTGAGDLVGFNNTGQTSPTQKSTIDRITSPRANYNYTINTGSAFTPSTYNSRLVCTAYNSNMGSSEQYPNGNQMICLAMSGSIYEVNSAGTTLWTYSAGGTTSQAHRYSQCYVNNAAPAIPTITVAGNDLQSTNATTYQWYLNGDLISGATAQNYTPTQSGIYVVRITDSNGCVYRYSPGYAYSVSTGISDTQTANISIYPNPSTGIVDINFNYQKFNIVNVNVYDMFGKVVSTSENNWRLDLSHLSNGVYTLSISLDNKKPYYQKVVLNK